MLVVMNTPILCASGLSVPRAIRAAVLAALLPITVPPPVLAAGKGGTVDVPSADPRIPISLDTTPGDDDSLFRIAAPGHYYLTATLVGVAHKSGIEVAANDVTIDLNEFTVQGIGTRSQEAGIRVQMNGDPVRLIVRNGTIRGWRYGLIGGGGYGSRYTNLTVIGNGSFGMQLGDGATVTDCTVANNGTTGLISGSDVVLTRVTARQNGYDGIVVGDHARIIDCAAIESTMNGFVVNGPGATLVGCIANGSAHGDGFKIAQGESTFERCAARNNAGRGFNLAENGSLTDCVASSNDKSGFGLGAGCVATNCTASNNAIDGFELFSPVGLPGSSRIENCTALFNQRNGFSLQTRSQIRGSLARGNGLHGIAAEGDCHVVGNQSVANGAGTSTGAGIYTTASGNHVEGNTCNGNKIGFAIVSGDNLVIRNTARGNQLNFSFAAGVEYGQVVDNPGSSFSNTNPWSNIGY
jgi:parallel beta-helix repeat protein